MADVIAYNGSDKWKQKATDLLNQGGGGGGLVDDVKVNGTSVVDENKVAQIDLTPYAKTADLATVATSGDYDDLTNKPTDATQSASGLMSSTDKTKLDGIASGAEVNVQSDWSQSDNTADDYIKNKPSIPSTASDVGAYTTSEVDTLLNGKQNTLTAGTNMDITSNTINCTLPFSVVNGKVCITYRREVTT